MLTHNEIYRKVCAALVSSLNVTEKDIWPDATLEGDLRADSIDFLDIVFRLEQDFGIRISHDELFPDTIFQSNPHFVEDGKVTNQGLAELRVRMPHADFNHFEKDPQLSQIGMLFTVDMISRYIQGRVGDPGQVQSYVEGTMCR